MASIILETELGLLPCDLFFMHYIKELRIKRNKILKSLQNKELRDNWVSLRSWI